MTELELAIGAALFLGYLMLDRRSIAWGSGWTWPIADLDYGPDVPHVPAEISQEYRASSPGAHFGIDLMYRSLGRGNAGARWYAPDGAPVLAARAGTLWSVTRTPRGLAVVIDHGPPWATFYQHLATVAAELAPALDEGYKRGSIPIAVEQQLGTIGADPTDPAHLPHLHFAVWYRGAGDAASIDPADAMRTWPRTVWRVPD